MLPRPETPPRLKGERAYHICCFVAELRKIELESGCFLTARLLGGRCKRTCSTQHNAAPYIQSRHHGDGRRLFAVGRKTPICLEKSREEKTDWFGAHRMR